MRQTKQKLKLQRTLLLRSGIRSLDEIGLARPDAVLFDVVLKTHPTTCTKLPPSVFDPAVSAVMAALGHQQVSQFVTMFHHRIYKTCRLNTE
jgi:hypothetical protein